MKTKKRMNAEVSVPNSVTLHQDGLEFFVINTKTGICSEFRIETYGSNDTFWGPRGKGENDSIILGLYFTEPFKNFGSLVHETLYVRHNGTLAFSFPLLPAGHGKPSKKQLVHILDRTYYTLPTHQLIIERSEKPISTKATTLGLFVQIVNVSQSTQSLDDVRIVPDISMDAWFSKYKQFNYHDCPFFPYNVDPALHNLRINPATIPQRTPLWFKLRGAVSGSKAYTLLGFWVPTKEKDPSWTLDGRQAVGPFQKAAMRFGSQSEDLAAIMYMMHYSNRRIDMVGWCPAPNWLPGDWGASPDGLITDTSLTWKDMPAGYTKRDHGDSLDPTRGALEIKSSKRSLKMDPYFLPQVYMEMICLRVMWCDLVRYRQQSHCDPKTHEWKYTHVARVFRIYRDPKVESQMIDLIKYALAHKAELQMVVHNEPAFLQFREFLEHLAESLPYREITSNASDNQSMDAVLTEYMETKKHLQGVQVNFPTTKQLVAKEANQPFKRHNSNVSTPQWFLQAQSNQRTLESLILNGADHKKAILKLLAAQTSLYSGALEKTI